jgi:3-dehydroquinate synthase
VTDVHVNLGPRSYDIHLTSGDRSGVGPFARQRTRGTFAFVVTDEHVGPHADRVADALTAAGLRAAVALLPAGEMHKSLATASYLYDRLAEVQADRQTLVVPVGGGVLGDLAGFVAATFARGLPLLMVPTTLLAMVDSSVGGKVGVNLPRAKNLVGAFHQPVGVWIDTDVLRTLPEREYRSGLAEVVKYGVILDAAFFAWLEEKSGAILEREPEAVRTMVARCCQLKADIVERDEREETGLRVVLNYGHTFAHAFETVGGYGAWLHGEAVAAGMVCASRLAQNCGLIEAATTERQIRLLRTFGLPVAPLRWPIDELIATMRSDKKAVAGRLRFVLPYRLGEVRLDEVGEIEVQRVLTEVMSEPGA